MKIWFVAALLGCIASASPGSARETPDPPVAAQKPHVVKAPFGAERSDPYYWLRDDTRQNPEMLANLNDENLYADAILAPTKPLQDQIFEEIEARIKHDDASVPYRKNGYYYYTRFETDGDYPIVARRAGSMESPEQILLDQPKMAGSEGHFAIDDYVVSPDNQLLGFAEDRVGRRQYVIRFKDLETGKLLPDTITNAEPNLVWADDNRTVFYIEKDPVTLLSKRVKAHILGTSPAADRLVYEEKDDSFYMGLTRTTDDKYICIALWSTVSNEYRCASSAAPKRFAMIAPRARFPV